MSYVVGEACVPWAKDATSQNLGDTYGRPNTEASIARDFSQHLVLAFPDGVEHEDPSTLRFISAGMNHTQNT